jgi:predicted metalloendopeptidase
MKAHGTSIARSGRPDPAVNYGAIGAVIGHEMGQVIAGFTGDQRFFMAHAQVWRGKSRDDALVSQLRADPHSPAAARGPIPERNVDAWYAAFDVQESDQAYIKPGNRVHIW